jgi:hypothetical protein
LHKRPKDISTIKGYVKCCDKVQDSLIDTIREENFTHFISLGDWYDKGYVDDVSSALADTSREEYINKILGGNFFGVIGNHIRLRLDSNPELMLIQPHHTIKSRKQVKRDEAIIKTPNHILLGNVQISLVHHMLHSESIEEYSIHRLPGVKYHVACLHDPRFVPNSKLALTQHPPTQTLDSQIARVLSNVDLAICGDIHMPLGMFDVSPTTKMIVPGSLTNTNAGLKGRHSSINMPILVVDDETDVVEFRFLPFDLHLNMLTFDEKGEQKVADKLKTIRGNNLEKLYGDKPIEGIMSSGISSLSFGAFLKEQQYTENDKNLIRATMKDPSNILELIKIHYADLTVREEV